MNFKMERYLLKLMNNSDGKRIKEKDFFKLMNNSVYRKTIKEKRNTKKNICHVKMSFWKISKKIVSITSIL